MSNNIGGQKCGRGNLRSAVGGRWGGGGKIRRERSHGGAGAAGRERFA